MSATTSIEWTDATWNPVRGCTKVSPGCKNCYAETFAERRRRLPGHAYEQGFAPRLGPGSLDMPRKWKQPRRIFVNSMSDLFHAEVPDEYIGRVFDVMRECPQHTFQVLTKRAARMRDAVTHGLTVPANVWLGVSVEDQERADERIPELLGCVARVLFLSCEPLLGMVGLAIRPDSYDSIGLNPAMKF